ncbi:hypothetical protein [Nocardioides bigeumensis]|uniref:Uncharacterized protein n=1 Tax=Nocardioides bigeumensis TaxID=433657 RepID=A0ABN2YUU3_9ACTN
MAQVSRRTVARGAAWAAPAVMVSVAAPAYAAVSYIVPLATLAAGTKCPGKGSTTGGNVYYYNLPLTLTSPGGPGYSFRGDSLIVGGVATSPAEPLTSSIPASGGTMLVRFLTDKSPSSYDVTVNYSVLQGTTVMGTYSISQNAVKFTPWKTGDYGYCP